MKLNHYQRRAIATAIYPIDSEIVYPALGLCGEAGEVAEKIKKVIRDGGDFKDPYTRKEIAKELGDVLWYLSAIADDLELTLEEVALLNLEKLEKRKKEKKLHGSEDNR